MALDILRNNPAALVASLVYDYSRIADPDSRAAMQSAALEIKPRLKRVVGDIVETGQQLLAVRDRCPHGEWGPWLATEFELSETMARNWMNLAESEVGKSANFADLPLSALYQLAAPSTPAAAVAAIEDKVGRGERVGVAEVKATIAQHKPSPAPAARPTGRCGKCGRELTDPEAVAAGIGACCARNLAAGDAAEVVAGVNLADVSDEGREWVRLQAAHGALSKARVGVEGELDVFEDYGFGQEAGRILRALYDLREEVRQLQPKDKIGGRK